MNFVGKEYTNEEYADLVKILKKRGITLDEAIDYNQPCPDCEEEDKKHTKRCPL